MEAHDAERPLSLGTAVRRIAVVFQSETRSWDLYQNYYYYLYPSYYTFLTISFKLAVTIELKVCVLHS